MTEPGDKARLMSPGEVLLPRYGSVSCVAKVRCTVSSKAAVSAGSAVSCTKSTFRTVMVKARSPTKGSTAASCLCVQWFAHGSKAVVVVAVVCCRTAR